jgi:excisionase family DNA binding protein
VDVEALMTVPEVAAELRLSRDSIDRRIKTGQLQVMKLGDAASSPVRIPKSELDRYLKMSRKRGAR